MKKTIATLALTAFLLNALNIYAGLSPNFHIYFNRPVNTAVSSGTNAVYVGGNTVDTIVAYINRAQYSIDVAQYDYTQGTTMGKIGTAINAAYARGVVVRWVYDESQANTGLPGLNAAIGKVGRPIDQTGNGYIMHDKFMIIDAAAVDTTLSIVYTASMDWGLEQDDSDFNNTVFIQSQQLAKAYTAQFNQMYGSTTATPDSLNSKWGSAKTSLGPHIFTIDGIEVELYFSPTDSTNNHILDAIASANSQLYFGMYTFSESLDAPPINAKYTAGVDVDGIIDQFTLETPTSQWATLLGTLGASRLKEYAQPNSIYHNKYLIVDACDVTSDPLVLTGSHNWTVGANEGNDENTIIMHDPTIANIYYQAFNQNFAYMGGTITGCTVTVNNCTNAISTTTQVNNNVNCYGASTGSATVHAHGAGVPFTYSWTGGSTDSTLSNVAAGTYTVTVTDHNACSVTASVTITQPTAALSVTGTATSPSCSGSSNGKISTTVTGGTSSYAYVWNTNPVQTTAIATNLTAGNYDVTVTDNNHCTASAAFTVNPGGSGITLSTSSTPTGCGTSTGSASVTVTSGTGTYTYHWSTGATTAQVTSLGSGSYTVTVSATGGCSATASAVVSSSGGPTVSASSTPTTCGRSNGAAQVTASGGSSPYTYSWTGGGTAATISNLSSGAYSVTVTDNNHCVAIGSTTVSASTAPSVSVTSTGASCGSNNGSATATVTGGTSPITYSWSNSGTTSTITNIATGNYLVTITDHAGCSATGMGAVSTTGTLTATASSTPTTCGQNTGSVSVTVTSGTGTYTYSWSNGATTAQVSSLGANTYTVTVSATGGCSATASAVVSSTGGPAVSASSTPTTCGLSNGTAHATASGGTSPYTYSWTGGGTASGISNLSSGSYTVTVTDNNHCVAIGSTNVGASTAPSLSVTSTNAVCGGNNASATATVTGGTSPITYSWSNNGTTSTISNIGTGAYHVTISDHAGCSATGTVQVDSSGAPALSVTTTSSTICANDTVQICAATGFESYHWSNGSSSACINIEQTGTYTVTAMVGTNCSAVSTPVQISTGEPPVVTVTVTYDVTSYVLNCSPAFAYQWYRNAQAIANATTNVYVATEDGIYTVNASSSGGCSTLSQPDTITFATGIASLTDNPVKIYPNPSSVNYWELEVPAEWMGATYQLFDANGDVITTNEIRAFVSQINCPVAQGIYFLKVTSGEQSIVKKVIKL